MNCLRQTSWWLALCVAGQCLLSPTFAGTVPAASPPAELLSVQSNPNLQVVQHPRSPVALFRQLLAMTPEERAAFLTNRPPQIRERILVKIREYEALDPNVRELRLRATELRWYLLPLMRESPSNRAAKLAKIPADIRNLVKSRLDQWIILPPQLQQEFLENEHALHYFTYVDVSNMSTLRQIAPPGSELQRWASMTEGQRKKIAANVNQFFELTPDEKQDALNTLSDAERKQMEKTLQSFDKLPPDQRTECVRAFAKFASMSAREKQEFLRNARRWAQMSPTDRAAWRDLVKNVPEWPPLPQGLITPPSPPPSPASFYPTASTNPN